MKVWNCASAGAVSLLAAAVLAGCGGGSAKSASASSASTPATTPTTPTSTAAKPPSSKPAGSSTTPGTSTGSTKPPAAKTSSKSGESANKEPIFGKVRLTSPAFKTGGPIPVKYTCDGASVSPPLEWGLVPKGTAEILVLAIDLSGSSSDAIQWAVAGISPSANSIPEGGLPPGAIAGVNSEGKIGWGAICGTKGQLHRVGFLFYALKHPLGLKSGFNPIQVRGGLKGSVLGTGLTLATYNRPS
ncbi:MAG TPA: YbhB/YbcL family Raf kinase inhibitor-like protein [Solirubrobacteraceae bacterium]|nr:YbhB/YbcL family Raf kinase inhibitor-like protein [Solirubrobacteraceae bacterium]